jgi:addiction module RelE/StbE family toxin
MIVRYDPEFFNYLKKLDIRIRKATKERLIIFSRNPNEPILHNHALKYEWKGYRSINITSNYRALYQEKQEGEDDIAYFVAIGTHDELYLPKN